MKVKTGLGGRRRLIVTEAAQSVTDRIASNALVRLTFPAILVALIVSEWVVFLTRSFETGMGQDFTSFYVHALAWLRGFNPITSPMPAQYATALHVRDTGFAESPLLLPIVAPFTLVPPRVAFLLFTAASLLLVGGGTYVLAGCFRSRRPYVLALAAIASPPSFLVCYYGQTGALVFIFVAIAMWARFQHRWELVGVCVACACIKPQLGLCAAVPLLWGAPARSWAWTAVIGTSLLGVMVLILGPAGMGSYVAGLQAFSRSASGGANISDGLGITSLYQALVPTAWFSGLTALAQCALLVAGILLIGRYRQRPSDRAIVVLTCLLTLLLPYSHQYDSIVLLPALSLGWSARSSSVFRRTLFWCGAALVIVSPLIAISSTPLPFRLVPLGLLLVAVSLTGREPRVSRVQRVARAA